MPNAPVPAYKSSTDWKQTSSDSSIEKREPLTRSVVGFSLVERIVCKDLPRAEPAITRISVLNAPLLFAAKCTLSAMQRQGGKTDRHSNSSYAIMCW